MEPLAPRQFFFWQRFLFIVGLVYVFFGLALSLLNGAPVFDVFHRQVDPVFWANGSILRDAIPFRSWIYSTAGATMTSWGVFLAFIAYFPLKRKEKWAWNCLLVANLTWYLIDAGMSLVYNVQFNVVFSTVSVLLIFVPLFFLRKEIFSGDAQAVVKQGE